MKIYNSLTRNLEEFKPIYPPKVGLYTCGMTVYDFAHIGHGRKYVGDDVLRRTLKRFGYDVIHVQNVTDVGHLVSDEDQGEDKMEKGAKKYGKTVWEVASYYTDHFYTSMDQLHILRPSVICKATDHIQEQIALIQQLITNGLAYDTTEAVYFDVTKFPGYASLFGRQKLEEKKAAARESVKEGIYKKHTADFALWFKRVGRFADHVMHWVSPWGDGFPGWHIECSAMSMKYLGESIDIHTGGIDHIPVHHPNEIAQSEGVTGKQFVKYWVHHNFLRVNGQKMSKSLGNYVTIEDVIQKGIDPMALRYFYLTSHYRNELNFTWEALTNAANSLHELRLQTSLMRHQTSKRTMVSPEKLQKTDEYRRRFDEALARDLNTPQALAIVWEVVKSNIPNPDKFDLLLDFDEVLGLKLSQETATIPDEIQQLARQIDELRREKKYDEADVVREDLKKKGYAVETTADGTIISKR